MNLIGIGNVDGTVAAEVKVGDRLMWNFGTTSTVVSIEEKSAQFIIVSEKWTDGNTTERRMKKTRTVCILKVA